MRTEVFRLEQVSLPPVLHDIHMHLYSGEVVALIGVNALGIDELLTIFQRNIPLHYGHVYCMDVLVNDYLSSSKTQNNVTVIDRTSMLLDTMTVEENLFILRKSGRHHIINYALLSKQMNILLKEVSLAIPPRTLVKDLSPYEKLIIQFLKASLSRSPLVILKDISTFVSDLDLSRLKPILDYFTKKGMTFLYVCNHHQEAFRFASRCYLMQEGRVIKHLFQDQMTDQIINQYAYEFNESVELGDRQNQYGGYRAQQVMFECRDLVYGDIQSLNLSVGSSETVVLLDSENMVLKQLFDLCTGEKQPYSGSITIKGSPPSLHDRGIAMVPAKPDVGLVFDQLSLLDNILFTSDHKVPNLWLSQSHRRALARDVQPRFGSQLSLHDPTEYDSRYRLRMVYQRIMLQKPEFLCVIQPFASIDMYQRMELISYFDAFKRRGTSILILAVSLSDTLQIADRLVILKDGKMQRELLRSEFSLYSGIVGSIPTQSKK